MIRETGGSDATAGRGPELRTLEKRRRWMPRWSLQKENSSADSFDFSLSNPFGLGTER